jgi:hypothetical protein
MVNLETTSGGNPSTDMWYLQNGLLNERAIERLLPARAAEA